MPIDPEFQKKRKKVGKEKGIAIWGPVDPAEKLGIHGTYVAIDWDICTGCGVCLEVCPKQLYEWVDTSGHPTPEKKSFPARESDCIQCLACETQCPAQAIRISVGGPIIWLADSSIWLSFGDHIGLCLLGFIWLLSQSPNSTVCWMDCTGYKLALLPFPIDILPKKGQVTKGKKPYAHYSSR